MNASGSPTDAEARSNSSTSLSIKQRLTERKQWLLKNAAVIKIGDVKRELERDLRLPNGQLDDARATAFVLDCVDAILIEALPRILAARVRASTIRGYGGE